MQKKAWEFPTSREVENRYNDKTLNFVTEYNPEYTAGNTKTCGVVIPVFLCVFGGVILLFVLLLCLLAKNKKAKELL